MSGTQEPWPQRFPRSAQDLRSTNLCPYCFTLITAGQRRCTDCGLDLSLPELAKVHARSVRIADLLDERSSLLTEARAASDALQQPAALTSETAATLPTPSAFAAPTPTPTGCVAPTTPPDQPASFETMPPVPAQVATVAELTPQNPAAENMPPADGAGVSAIAAPPTSGPLPAAPTQPTPARLSRPSLSVPMLILAVGITFLAIAAAVFLTVAFVTFSLTTKALITATITLSTMGIASLLRWRQLTATAEGVAVLGGILLTLDAWAIQALNFFGLGAAPNSLYWGSALCVISLLCADWGWVSKLRAPRLMAALACIPGVSSLVFGLLGHSADLPVLIPLGIALVVAATALLSRAPARPLEAGTVIGASHIAVLTVILTPWFEEPEPWAWTVAGHFALVVALIVQMAAFRREDRWRSLALLRYSAAILAATAWMSAASYTALRIQSTLSWGPAVFAALAGLGLVIVDAAIRPRARAAGVVANITLGLLWLPLLLGATLPTAINMAFTRAVVLSGDARTTDSPQLLAFGLATLATVVCAAGLYALLGPGRDTEHDEADAPVPSQESLLRSRANLLAAVAVLGIVTTSWALPTLLATVLLVVLTAVGAVIGGLGLARKGGVNLALQADLLMGLGALAVFFTQDWGSGRAAWVSGGLLVAGVTRTVLTNAGAQVTLARPIASEPAIRALSGTLLALIAAVSTHFHLYVSQQDWPGYILTAGLGVAGILVCVPLVWTRRLLAHDAGLLAVGGTVLTVLDLLLLLIVARTGLWLEPGMIAVTTLLGIVVAGTGCVRLATAGTALHEGSQPESLSYPHSWPRVIGAPVPVFIAAGVAGLGHLIGRAGLNKEATQWMVLGEAPTILGVSALIAALALVIIRVRSDAHAQVPIAAQRPFSALTAPAVMTVAIAAANLLGITQQLATGTTMLADGAGLLATALALVALGAVLGRTVSIGPPISWVGAAVIGIYGPGFLSATLVDPWPLLVVLPLVVALAASGWGLSTRPASHTRGGAWSVAALIAAAYAILIVGLIVTAIREHMLWMHVLTLTVALVMRALTTMLHLPERFQPATWLISVTTGIGAAVALSQLVSMSEMRSIPAATLVACVSAVLIALPARLQGRIAAPPTDATRPTATPIAPSVTAALILLACADITVIIGLTVALSTNSVGMPFGLLLGGMAAGVSAGSLVRLVLMRGIGARTPISTQDAALLSRTLLGAGIVPVVSTALVAVSATLAFHSRLHDLAANMPSELPNQMTALSTTFRFQHSVLMAIAAVALAASLVYLARNSAIVGRNDLVNATAASLPATVWAAVAALPTVGEWAWWAVLSAGVGAIVLAGVAVLTRGRVDGVMLWAAAATVPLPLIALLTPQADRVQVGVGVMLVAAALCVLIFAAPSAQEMKGSGEALAFLRGVSVALTMVGAFVLSEAVELGMMPVATLPALSLPAGLLSAFTAGGVLIDRVRSPKAAGEAPIYAALAPVLTVSSLAWSAGEAGEALTIWALSITLAMAGVTVLLALGLRFGPRLWMRADMSADMSTGMGEDISGDASSPAPLLPVVGDSVFNAAIVGHSLVSLVALWIYGDRRSFTDMTPLSWVDYGVGVGVACALLIAAAVSAWSSLPHRSLRHQLPVIATGGGVSVATAILGALIVNVGTFPAEGMMLPIAFLALSILAAIPVVVVGVAPNGPTYTRTMIVGLIAAAAALHRAFGALVTGHDTAIEIFVVPLGLALLLVGILAVERGVGKTSWITCAPGLVLLVGIPVIAEVMERGAWRIGMMTVVIVAVIMVGVTCRLQAPLLAGSVAALIHAVIAVRTALPELVVPWWVWLSIAGIILVVVASTYEARLRDARRIGEAVRAMR